MRRAITKMSDQETARKIAAAWGRDGELEFSEYLRQLREKYRICTIDRIDDGFHYLVAGFVNRRIRASFRTSKSPFTAARRPMVIL